MHRRRAEFFDGKVCVECGSESGLELHHVDPEQKVSHRIWSWARERREAELAKCVVLCGPCHGDADFGEGQPHGSPSRYAGSPKRAGCRCAICRAANAAGQRIRRAARQERARRG